MKKKISELVEGDVVDINGHICDVFETPSQLSDGRWLFAVVHHGRIEAVRNMAYTTPADLSYEVSSRYENDEITVLTEQDLQTVPRKEIVFNERENEPKEIS